MVGSCVAPGCTNYYSPRRHVSYFRFPNPSKYPDLHKAWIGALQIPDFVPSKHSCVCELHFNEEDFDETYRMKKALMPSDYFRPILKQEAVPKLEIQGGGLKESGEKVEILRDLLGDSYLKWKRTATSIVKIEKVEEDDEGEEKGEKAIFTLLKVKKEEKSEFEEKVEKKVFNITRDFVLKQPLKPLPEKLQRLIPSILSVIIREAPDKSDKPQKTQTNDKQFFCGSPLPIKFFHCCQLCDFTTFLKINLLNHTRTAHRPIKTKEIERLPMKIYKHKEPKIYACGNCDFSTFSRLMFLRHAYKTKEYHLIDQIEVKWFKCELCAYKSRRSGGLKKHILMKHESKMKFQCEHCDYCSEKEENLKKHLRRQHDRKDHKSFPCQICPYKSVDLAVLQKHVSTRHPKRHYRLRCLSCDYTTIRSNFMRKHILAKHTPDSEVKWYECKNCQFRTKYQPTFENHCLKRHGAD